MHRAAEFIGQGGIDAPLALHPVYAVKDVGNDAHMEMGFALAAIATRRPGMAGMAMTFIHHFQRHRCERGHQFFMNGLRNTHQPCSAFPASSSEAIGQR